MSDPRLTHPIVVTMVVVASALGAEAEAAEPRLDTIGAEARVIEAQPPVAAEAVALDTVSNEDVEHPATPVIDESIALGASLDQADRHQVLADLESTVVRVAQRHIGLSDDIAQELRLFILTNGQIETSTPPKLARRILERRAIDAWRRLTREDRRAEFTDYDLMTSPWSSPEATVQAREALDAIASVNVAGVRLETLRALADGATPQDIADDHGILHNAARQRVFQARRALPELGSYI